MRAGFTAAGPHPGPLPQGEGEKHCAPFDGRVSNLSPHPVAIRFILAITRRISSHADCFVAVAPRNDRGRRLTEGSCAPGALSG